MVYADYAKIARNPPNWKSVKLGFTKMQGVGNDFVVIDAINQRFVMSAQLARRLADRHFGIGCDQILLVEPSDSSEADFRYRIFNADGGEVEQCGNGARCFVRFVHDRGLSKRTKYGCRRARASSPRAWKPMAR